MNKQKIYKYLGTFLMVLPLLLLTFVYYPIFVVYLFPYQPPVIKNASLAIEIPAIKASSSIIENVDPWNKDEYIEKLQLGVAHAKGTLLPGEGGTSYLFAHSSDVPWRLTRYNTAFFKLSNLKNGDEIIVYKGSEQIKYVVDKKIEVSPEEVKYLTESQGDVLILQTCTPIGTDWKRLLVFAKPI